MIYQDLIDKNTKLAVIGLGYVGLPIALEFAKRIKVIGFDINEGRIAQMQRSEDPSRELSAADFQNRDITFIQYRRPQKSHLLYCGSTHPHRRHQLA